MKVQELIDMLSTLDPKATVSLSVDTGRSIRYGACEGYSIEDDMVILCGEEDEDFCE